MQLPALPRIVYVGNFKFPEGDAGAHRVYGIGKALREAGHEVVFLGVEQTGRPQDAVTGDEHRFDNFLYYPAGNTGNSPRQRAWRLWHTHLSGSCVIARLKSVWTDDTVAVFAYQASSPLLARLRCFCDRHHAALVADVVEWYDRRHVAGGRYGLFALDSEIRMRLLHGKADGIVVISSYLEIYYRRFGIPMVRIPAMVDVRAVCGCVTDGMQRKESALQLAFVGNAGKKDFLVNAIRGLALLGQESSKWELVIVGPSKDEVTLSLGDDANLLEQLNNILNFVGRVPHIVALSHLRQADFSILMRPDLRFAHAGFPTKLVESMAMGVPVICNLTSDIGIYVQDGREGLVIPDCSPEAFAAGLRRAMTLSLEQRTAMRASSRRRAEVSFDYRNWTEPLGEFLQNVIANHNRQK